MLLFLSVFAPGMLMCWLYMRNRNSWGHAVIGMILGALASYGAVYVLGNYVQVDLVEETHRQFGEQLATDIHNTVYGNALKYAVAAIIGCAIALKMKRSTAASSR